MMPAKFFGSPSNLLPAIEAKETVNNLTFEQAREMGVPIGKNCRPVIARDDLKISCLPCRLGSNAGMCPRRYLVSACDPVTGRNSSSSI